MGTTDVNPETKHVSHHLHFPKTHLKLNPGVRTSRSKFLKERNCRTCQKEARAYERAVHMEKYLYSVFLNEAGCAKPEG